MEHGQTVPLACRGGLPEGPRRTPQALTLFGVDKMDLIDGHISVVRRLEDVETLNAMRTFAWDVL